MSEDVVDAAVVGLEDEIKGNVPFGFIVVNKGMYTIKLSVIVPCSQASLLPASSLVLAKDLSLFVYG